MVTAPRYGHPRNEWQVFDLSVDPGENNDLSTSDPKLKRRFVDAWDEDAKSVGVIPPEDNPLTNN
jgi:hypothetical protein